VFSDSFLTDNVFSVPENVLITQRLTLTANVFDVVASGNGAPLIVGRMIDEAATFVGNQGLAQIQLNNITQNRLSSSQDQIRQAINMISVIDVT
jgi:hypothetical protein